MYLMIRGNVNSLFTFKLTPDTLNEENHPLQLLCGFLPDINPWWMLLAMFDKSERCVTIVCWRFWNWVNYFPSSDFKQNPYVHFLYFIISSKTLFISNYIHYIHRLPLLSVNGYIIFVRKGNFAQWFSELAPCCVMALNMVNISSSLRLTSEKRTWSSHWDCAQHN